MGSIFSGNAVAQLIIQSDVVSKLVLLILLVISVASWTIFLQKYIAARAKEKELKSALTALQSIKTIEQLQLLRATVAPTFVGQFITPAFHAVQQAAYAPLFSLQDDEDLSLQQQALIDELVSHERESIAFLNTASEVGTLLGLFGTIWGLIHSFIRISERQSADIVTVAPGIAEALITTRAGLLVTIPALALYHVSRKRVARVEQLLYVLLDRWELLSRKMINSMHEVRHEARHAPAAQKTPSVSTGTAGQSHSPY